MTTYTREHPSARYRELLGYYQTMHTEGEKFLNLPPEKTFPGQSLLPHAGRIRYMVERTQAKSILDYGAGKGKQYEPMNIEVEGVGRWPDIRSFWNVETVHCYDPAFTPFSRLPEETFDGVISTDVLEHCPQDDVDWIVAELFRYAKRFVYTNVACYPAAKRLPNGENAHCTIQPPDWWEAKFRHAAANWPDVLWEVWMDVPVQTPAGAKLRELRIGSFERNA